MGSDGIGVADASGAIAGGSARARRSGSDENAPHAPNTDPRIDPPIYQWDRFARFSPLTARFALFAFLACVAMSAIVPINAGRSTIVTQGFVENAKGEEFAPRKRDDDLALYDLASERIAQGDNYYDFIVEEQRKAQYPIRPGIAVRLPTLAYINAALGETGQTLAAALLMLAVMIAWWRRLGEEPGGKRRRMLAMALLFVGASLGMNKHFFALHELWSGMLLALAFALHRASPTSGPVSGPVSGGKWGASLAVAALALAIREHALPFVLLMAALAAVRRNWTESAAWSALALAFLVALALHLGVIADQALATDRTGQGWMMLRGLSGWMSNIVLSSNLRFFPHWLAGPLVMLMLLGWAAWRSPAGLFASFLFLGYGLLFMIAGRGDNYYWGAMVAPAMFIGLAFAPMGLKSLVKAASAK